MKHEIKQKSTILIFALVLMAFVTHSIHRDNLAVAQFVFVAPVKNPQVFAQAAYDKFKRILTRDDLLPLLPDVLTALKDDKFANPNLSVEIFFTPPLLRQHIPNIDERFITLLDVPEIIEMFTDFEMTRLYGFPAAIDALLDLLAPHLKQVKIVSAFVNAGRYGTLIITGSGMQIGESVAVGTTHTLIFTIINAEGNPVPGLPLNYSINPLDGTAATATFNPATATTNQDGKVYAEITFGPNPGDLRLFAEVDSQRIVEFVELELTQGNTNVNNVTMKGLEHGFARTGTTQTLVFKATDANGRPVQGEELMFGARSEYSSAATATFDPATATTDQNGEARTQITFGAKPGGINLTVQSGPAVEQVNITASQVDLGSQVEGAFTGLQVGDSVDVGSIHTLVFTATDLRGRPVSGLPIAFTFGGIPLELEAMFDPATATTDRRGQVRTQVTFGEEPGDFQLIVSMDPQRVIVFSEPEFRLGGTNIANLKIQGMEEGFAQPGSSINLVLTATDASGRPVAGEELVFGVGIIPDSQAMVESLQPVKVKTNKKGKAQTRVMFGPEPGEIRLTVKSGVIIHSVLFDVAPYGMMEFKGLQIADGVKVNSTHDLVFTVTNENGKPVPWLPLQLSAVDLDVFAQAATFTPTPRVVTNKNGKARTSITFGDVHGDVRLIATVDRQQIVEFPNPNPKITLNNSKIARLTVKGIEHGFARVGSTRNLLFTAMDKNGNPVEGVKFGFGFRSQLDSNATATFDPATVTTDENGQAETQVTFGQNPGGLRFTIQPPANKITIQSVSSDFNLSMLGDGELTSESFELGDAFKIGSTHNFVFTATKANGDPVPWLPLRFDALYLDGTEAGLTFAPPTVTTNKNGKARMSVTFSGGPGDIRLIAEVDREQIVEFSDPEITLDGSSVAQLTLKGIEQGFSRVGTVRTLVFTTTDENGDPVSGVELAFGFRSESDSKATATFSAETVTTDKNGKAETKVTFGSEPGSLRFTVQPIEQVRIRSASVGLGKYGDLTFEEFEVGDSVEVGSTHTLVFTATDLDGNVLPGAPLVFSADPLEDSAATATFSPVTAITDINGRAQTDITFGSEAGDFHLNAGIDKQQIIDILLPGDHAFVLDDETHVLGINEGFESGFVRIGSTHTVVCTANGGGGPSENIKLTFGFENYNSEATATFVPPIATTNANGIAHTQVTFGPKPGTILFAFQPIPQVIIDSVNSPYCQDLFGFGELMSEGFELGDRFDVNSTHTIAFTLNGENGNPMPRIPLVIAVLPLDLDSTHPLAPSATLTPKLETTPPSPLTRVIETTTDENGKVIADISFGSNSGPMYFIVYPETSKMVQVNHYYRRTGVAVANLDIDDVGKYVLPNSTHTLVFTATDEDGDPVVGAKLAFRVEREFDETFHPSNPEAAIARSASATVNPATSTTNIDGQVSISATFGSNPGSLRVVSILNAISGVDVEPGEFVFHGFLPHKGSVKYMQFIGSELLQTVASDPDSEFAKVQQWNLINQQLLSSRSDIFVTNDEWVVYPPRGPIGGWVIVRRKSGWDQSIIHYFDPPNPAVELEGHTARISAMAFHPDGKILASGAGDSTVRLWDIPSGEKRLIIQIPKLVSAVAFSPDGQTLATGSSSGINLWDPYTGAHKDTIEIFVDTMGNEFKFTPKFGTDGQGLAFTPDGQTLAVIAQKTDNKDDTAIVLWDLETDTVRQVLPTEGISIRDIVFARSGNILAAGGWSRSDNAYGSSGPHVLLWRRELLSLDRIELLKPHSIEISGPSVITSVVAYTTFTVTVKNSSGQPLPNVKLWFKTLEMEKPALLWTDEDGNIEYRRVFRSFGKHDIDITVLDIVTGKEIKKNFPNRFEVLTPHTISRRRNTPETLERGEYYRDTFTVQDAKGRAIEGLKVKINTANTSILRRTTYAGEALCTMRVWSRGIYDVNVVVLNPVNDQEFLKKTFPRLLTIERAHEIPHDPEPELDSSVYSETERMVVRGNGSVAAVQPPKPIGHTSSMQPVWAWTRADTIAADLGTTVYTVKFLNGTREDREDVVQAVKAWSDVANIDFWFYNAIGVDFDFSEIETYGESYVNGISYVKGGIAGMYDGPADLRVKFYAPEDDEGSSSTVGVYESVALSSKWSRKIQRFFENIASGLTQIVTALLRPLTFDLIEEKWINELNLLHHASGWVRLVENPVELVLTLNEVGHRDPTIKLTRRGKKVEDEYVSKDRAEWTPTDYKKWKGTILHEFGHALGFRHTHQTKAFPFEWIDDRQKIYDDFDWSKDKVDRNVFLIRRIPENNRFFDPNSIMTYDIPAEWIKTPNNASDEIKEMAEETGIPKNRVLSDLDKEALANMYGRPRPVYSVTGTLHIDGVDDEELTFDEPINETYQVQLYVSSQEEFSSTLIKDIRWGGELRVEVHIASRKVDSKGIEMKAYAALYEGVDRYTTDREDSDTVGFTLPLDGKEVEEELFVENKVFKGKVEIADNVAVDFLEGFINAGVEVINELVANDNATVTLKLRASLWDHAEPVVFTGAEFAAAPPIKHSYVDVNGDGQVDTKDLLLVSNYIGQTGAINPRVDVNGDGIVTIADLVQVAQYLGQSTYSSAPNRVVVPAGLTYKTVQSWIDSARAADDGSLAFRQGITNLELLLTLIIPEETALLHNYPNPFNPETWIPYHLSGSAYVSLTIYAIDGKVVRHLDLGHQAAGYYQSKSRAAHWDGRNNVGERVASGIYFYTITAGDFTATRKMLIRK